MISSSAPAECVVLDTNAVLDWLVFGNAAFTSLTEHLAAGRLLWVGTSAMRTELELVLARDSMQRWSLDIDAVLQACDRHCVLRDPPVPPLGGPHSLRCTDASDQMFIDLAIATRAHWLITRDRALLKLAKRARPIGLRIAVPEQWVATWTRTPALVA